MRNFSVNCLHMGVLCVYVYMCVCVYVCMSVCVCMCVNVCAFIEKNWAQKRMC